MPEQSSKADYSLWRAILTAPPAVFFVLNHVVLNKRTMEMLTGASSSEISYWGTKAAGFALTAAVALFITLIPAKSRLANLAPQVVGGLAAVYSGFYWLQESTSGNAGGYIAVVAAAGIIISVSILWGPIIVAIRERRSDNTSD